LFLAKNNCGFKVNFKLLYNLLVEQTFPCIDDVGWENQELLMRLEAVSVHISDYRDYLRVLVLENIKQGYCDPRFLAGLYEFAGRTSFDFAWSYYGFSYPLSDNEIFDIKNVNERRTAIGLCSLEYQRLRTRLIMSLYNIEHK
jgi:hypothetical protein